MPCSTPCSGNTARQRSRPRPSGVSLRLGIFSDVHANLEALDAVLADLAADRCEAYLIAGDLVGYGADPEPCITRVRRLPVRALVAGNHDWAAAGRIAGDDFNTVAGAALAWTRETLPAPSVRYLGRLPLRATWHDFTVVHAAPSAPGDWEYIDNIRDAAREFEYFTTPVCLIGHSHVPFVIERRGTAVRRVTGDDVILDPDAGYLVNVGSVGQPRDGRAEACALRYDTGTRRLSFRRVAYDVGRAQAKIRAAGLPEFLARRLAAGR